MDSSIVIAIIGFSGTLVAGYFTFRSKLEELKTEAKEDSQTAIRAANEMMFQQIQIELTRRDKRIEQLESKIVQLENDRQKRQKEIEEERDLNRKLSDQLNQEKATARRHTREIESLRNRVKELENENNRLKRQVKGIKTGMLNNGDD